ncbi:MAG TPA: ATP-dependent Clp protease proteolytic subunit, partial [Paludibacter sp.]|nr:ATP-dependent Clp protease proteolytic subunit [Paludibacter sp.]
MSKNVIQLVGGISTWEISRNYVKYLLDEAPKGPLNVEISSLGGDVNQALMIKKLIADRGDVTLDYFGFCASAVTLLGHGASKTRIYDDAMYLVHKPL